MIIEGSFSRCTCYSYLYMNRKAFGIRVDRCRQERFILIIGRNQNSIWCIILDYFQHLLWTESIVGWDACDYQDVEISPESCIIMRQNAPTLKLMYINRLLDSYNRMIPKEIYSYNVQATSSDAQLKSTGIYMKDYSALSIHTH